LSSHPAQARRVREGEAVAVLVNRDVKIEELSVAQLEAIYRILPEGSRGREADNPGWFNFFCNPEQYMFNRDAWPYAVLCEDMETGRLTWHIFCSDWDLAASTFNFTLSDFVSMKASLIRTRLLKAIEIIWRRNEKGKEYYEHHSFPSY
ncbi:MAG: hypothetical protein NTZ48_05090, partial [Candidatus Omnitrophica bacterium]|nr:hypothetical protein [Candidatus Omnitrophota bacterium]